MANVNLFIYLFMAVLDLHCCEDFSLAVVNGGLLFIALCRLLTVAASLVADASL